MDSTGHPITTAEELVSAQRRLKALLQEDRADEAIALARSFRPSSDLAEHCQHLVAVALTDSGALLKRRELIAEGRAIWRGLGSKGRMDTRYNEANALSAMWDVARLYDGLAAAWQQDRDLLFQARDRYTDVARDSRRTPVLRQQALVNAGNMLSSMGRHTEALQLYDGALALDPAFAMAQGNRGMALAYEARYAGSHHPTVRMEAARLLDAALHDPEGVLRYGGTAALQSFQEARSKVGVGKVDSRRDHLATPWSDPYWEWCRAHDLLLHVSPWCMRETATHLDEAHIGQLSASTSDRFRDLFDSYNTIRQDYVSSRYLAWVATNPMAPMAAHLSIVGRRTAYRQNPGRLQLDLPAALARQALSQANNVLDKIACFLHLYMETGRGPTSVQFRGWWKIPNSKPEAVHPEFLGALGPGELNMGLMALCDVSAEFQEGGARERLQRGRHAATHRFLVVQEPPTDPSDPWIERRDRTTLHDELLDHLKMARLSILYLNRAVDRHEQRRVQSST